MRQMVVVLNETDITCLYDTKVLVNPKKHEKREKIERKGNFYWVLQKI